MNGETIRTITIRGQSEGLDKLTADVNKLAAAQENVAIVSEQSAKRVLSLEDAWKRQTMRLDEAARAQANIARETKVADAALREGLATQAQHAQRLEQINQRYTKTADATKVVAHQTGLARHELVNLGRQAQDVGVSLMSGQSPFTVLVQQGTQIADVFATSGGTLRGFFGQAVGWAKTFLTSTAGIVTSVLAVGAAAIYAASQFRTASTTIEEALEEQNRLLKEAKTLIDAKASAESKAFAQSKELTQFQLERSQRDIEDKLRAAQEGAAIAARGRSTRPTQVGGEMGEAPTGVASLGPGYERIADAVQRLNDLTAAGQPGLAAFQEELAKVGRAHPELAQTAQEMIKLAQQGIPLEQASLKLRAVSDALKGIATDAQLAAVGLGSIAQFNLANLRAEQAAAATERMAQYTQQLAALYPGMTIEGAKQLHQTTLQLAITQARTPEEKNIAEANAQQAQMLAAGVAPAETLKIIAIQRGVAEKDLLQTMELQNARALQRAQTTVETTSKTGNLADAASDVAEKTWNAARGMSSYADNAYRAAAGVGDIASAVENRLDMLGTQFKGSYVSSYDPLNLAGRKRALEERYGAENVVMKTGGIGDYEYATLKPGAQSIVSRELQEAVTKMLGTTEEKIGRLDISSPEAIQRSFESIIAFGFKDGLGPVNRLIDLVADPAQQVSLIQQAIEAIRTTQQPSLAREEMINSLNSKLEQLTNSTDSLNSTMQDALSPYYSQDPRTTKLGFRAGVTGNPDWMTGAGNANPLVAVLGAGATAPGMANGGSFTVGGGYSSNDNAMAVFPVASGEEVVVNRNPQGRASQVVNIDNRIFISGTVDADTLSRMKVSRYQQSQKMRAGLAQAS